MATSAITTPTRRARAIDALWARPLADTARIVARVTLRLAASSVPLIVAAWLVYPMSPAGALLAGVAGMLAGVWLGAWLATSTHPTPGADRLADAGDAGADREDASQGASQGGSQGASDGGRADV